MSTWTEEITSWLSPTRLTTSAAPEIGKSAPSTEKLKFPPSDGKPVVVSFLRHCGCPFAEQTYLRMRKAATAHPSISFIAVSQSQKEHTDKWLQSIPAPEGGKEPSNLKIIIDDGRELFARWGLGVSSLWHVLNPSTLGKLGTLKKEEGIDVRPTNSGNRWQTAGSWAADSRGTIRWGGVAKSADDVADFEAAVGAVTRA